MWWGDRQGYVQTRIETGQATRNISRVLFNRWGKERAEASCGAGKWVLDRTFMRKKQGLMMFRRSRKLCWTIVVDCGNGGRWKAGEGRDGGARRSGTYNSC